MSVPDHELTSALALTPQELARYLDAAGWRRERPYGRTDLWSHQSEAGHPFEVLLPRERTLGDYTSRVADLVETLAVAEQRPTGEVVEALRTSGMDVPSVRLKPDAPSGTIPIGALYRAVGSAREMLLAAATRALTDQPVLVQPAQRPARAREFAKRVTVGTSAGSFVLRLLIPLSAPGVPVVPDQRQLSLDEPEPANPEPANPAGERGQPFERAVSWALFTGVQTAHHTAQAVLRTDGLGFLSQRMNPADLAVLGLSANLCDALAGFAGEDDDAGQRGFEVRFSWSTGYPMRGSTPVTPFPREFVAPLRAVAGYLRDQLGEPGVTVVGRVRRLHREYRAGPGEITLEARVVGGPPSWHRIRVQLSEQDYSAAIIAHEAGHDVSITGDLIRRGGRRVLRAPRDLTVIQPPD